MKIQEHPVKISMTFKVFILRSNEANDCSITKKIGGCYG
jgi:hypothetical protein